jgi:hypothetical protein
MKVGRRTAAERLRESASRTGPIEVVVDAAGDGVPIAAKRGGRGCHASAVLNARGARRNLARLRGDELAVARRTCRAAGAAECKCCTARRGLPGPRGSGDPA